MNTKAYIESGLLEAYVLGALPEADAAGVACMAAGNPDIATELLSIEDALINLANAAAITPPPALQDAIWASIQSAGPQAMPVQAPDVRASVPPMEIVSDSRQQQARRIDISPEAAPRRRASWLQAAAIIALLGSAVFNYVQNQQQKELIGRQQKADQQIAALTQQQAEMNQQITAFRQERDMMMQPAMKMVLMRGTKDGRDMAGMVFWNARQKEAYVSLTGMPAPPAGKQYQLWAIDAGKPVSLGMMPVPMAGKPGAQHVDKTVASGQAFAVSLEPMGGSVSPTTDQILVVGAVQG